jgi:hypothetical protein
VTPRQRLFWPGAACKASAHRGLRKLVVEQADVVANAVLVEELVKLLLVDAVRTFDLAEKSFQRSYSFLRAPHWLDANAPRSTPFAHASPHSHQSAGRSLRDVLGVNCSCGEQREIDPQALAPRLGWSITLEQLAQRLRCARCGKRPTEVVAVAEPRPGGTPKIPH